MFTSTVTSFLLLTIHLSSTSAQFISSLPGCVQTCLSNSQDESCSTFDVACFCRAAATGDFLTDALTCIHTQCDSDMNDNILVMPLQFACGLAGTPIPKAVVSSAEERASSLATETASATATTSVDESSTAGAASTSAQTSLIPTILPGSGGSSISTTTSTQSAAASTSATPRSGTHTSTSTHTVASSVESSSSISDASQSTFSTDSASRTSSSSETSSKTSAAPNGDNTDSAPFTNTNDAPNMGGNVGTWFALTIAMAAGFALVLS